MPRSYADYYSGRRPLTSQLGGLGDNAYQRYASQLGIDPSLIVGDPQQSMRLLGRQLAQRAGINLPHYLGTNFGAPARQTLGQSASQPVAQPSIMKTAAQGVPQQSGAPTGARPLDNAFLANAFGLPNSFQGQGMIPALQAAMNRTPANLSLRNNSGPFPIDGGLGGPKYPMDRASQRNQTLKRRRRPVMISL